MTALALIVTLLASPSVSKSAGATHWVEILPVEGVQADSLERAGFLQAFRGVFDESEFDIESQDGVEAAHPLSNRFRPLDRERDSETWTLLVTVKLPPLFAANRRQMGRDSRGQPVMESVRRAVPKRRASRGMKVSVTVISPDDVLTDASPVTSTIDIAFPANASVEGSTLVPSPSGYVFPWAAAGRTTGLLAVETLHRRSGDLPIGGRIHVVPAERIAREE